MSTPSLKDLKKSSKDNLNKIIQEAEKMSKGPQRQTDERFWQPTVDKSGNGFALIRFLPAPPQDGDDALPWVIFYDHGFKGPSGKWYIERSLTSIGQKDPLGEYNSKLWNSGEKDLQDQARTQKRRKIFISNIYVITDPGNPENNGKVFLYRYGQKVFEKIKNVMTPEEDFGEAPNDPFDFWNGQNFKLKIKNVAGYRNYDDSSFAQPSVLIDDDDKLEEIWKSEHSLREFLDPSQFKTYDELKTKLYDVLDMRGNVTESADKMADKVGQDFDKETELEAAVKETDSSAEDAELEDLLKEFK